MSTAVAYEHLGISGRDAAVECGLTSVSTDEEINRIKAEMLSDTDVENPAPFDVDTLGPALATWRDDLASLEGGTHVIVLGNDCEECSDATGDDERCDEEDHTYSLTVLCPGTEVGHCQTYWQCGCEGGPQEVQDEGEAPCPTRGGVHLWMSGDGSNAWHVLGPQCFVANNDNLRDAVDDIGLIGPGRYPVLFDAEDFTGISLERVTA